MELRARYGLLVKYFGSQQKTANAMGCSQPCVWKWLNGKSEMSAINAIKAERLTGGEIKASELCPDLLELEDYQWKLNHPNPSRRPIWSIH